MANKLPRVPVREQDPVLRATNFEEVCYGYNLEEAQTEASRCLHCKNPRCVAACPVGVQIPDFILRLREGDLPGAAAVIARDSSLPSICGRVCPQESQCEGACILGIKGEPVAVGKLERFVGDWSIEHSSMEHVCIPVRNGRRVAVIGSGPAGLACASDLAKMGYEVKIFEALHKVGGVLVYGIPEFRLPKQKIVEREIDAVRRLGVEIETDVIVGRTVTVDSLLDEEGFDAVFIGSGAGLPRFMGIPGENLNGVVSANEFLTRANLMHAYDDAYDTPIYVGRRVAVVGGGNVAMDVTRSSIRLGAEKVTCVYRRRVEDMTALPDEITGAMAEGAEIMTLAAPVRIEADEEGVAKALWVQPQIIGEVDKAGRPRPGNADLPEVRIEADIIVVAIGQGIEISGFDAAGVPIKRGTFVAGLSGQVGDMDNVFAGGDCVTGPATAIRAIAAGKVAAANIDEHLGYRHEITVDVEIPSPKLNNRAPHGRINTTEREAGQRRCDFEDIECGLTQEGAVTEASRCLRCDHFGYGIFKGGRVEKW